MLHAGPEPGLHDSVNPGFEPVQFVPFSEMDVMSWDDWPALQQTFFVYALQSPTCAFVSPDMDARHTGAPAGHASLIVQYASLTPVAFDMQTLTV
jgi:hypothetical protein